MTEPPSYPPPTPYEHEPTLPPPSQAYPVYVPESQYGAREWNIPIAPIVKPGTNGWAIAALVAGILGTCLFTSFIFGIVALIQTSRTGQKGKGLAIAGLVIGSLWLIGAFVAGVVSVLTEGPERDESGTITGAGLVYVEDLKIGDCLNDVDEDHASGQVPAVPCSEPHEAQVFTFVVLTDPEFPGNAAVSKAAERGCSRDVPIQLRQDLPLDAAVFYYPPTATNWKHGDRRVICMVGTPDKRTGSLMK